jgi:hypothetical protein
MKIAVLLTRHRRLLALCGLSACAHLLVLELVAQRAGAPASAPPAGEALRLRLAHAAAPAPAAEPHAEASAAPQPVRQAGPADRADPAPSQPAQETSPALPSPAPAAPATAAAPPAAEGIPLIQMPSRYRVRMPEPVRLSYALTRQAPGAAPLAAGAATLDWRSDGERYALTVDGVLGVLRSEGGSSDAGIAPRFAQDQPDAVGAQDRASVLMQLAGIGLAEPDQIRGQVQNELRIVVAGADGAAIARYQVMGQEQLQTALGAMEAWRLAQVVPAGQERIEVWLAPGQGWLPVQIRLIRADGSAATQTLTRVEPGAPR